MRESRLAENRPYVVLYLEFKEHEVWLVCKNIGKTAAYDVYVSFDKPFYGIGKYDVQKNLFARPFPTMAPNYEIKSFIDSSIDIKQDNCKLEKEEYILTALIEYNNCKKHGKKGEYLDEYRISICDHQNVLFTPSTETKNCENIGKIAVSMEKLTKGNI
jgi:ATP phosphoribosyltransferase regulatory subunit HisZ